MTLREFGVSLPYCPSPHTPTYAEQIAAHDAWPETPETCNVVTYPDSGWESESQRAQMWSLSDWRVSSVSGGAIWLVRR